MKVTPGGGTTWISQKNRSGKAMKSVVFPGRFFFFRDDQIYARSRQGCLFWNLEYGEQHSHSVKMKRLMSSSEIAETDFYIHNVFIILCFVCLRCVDILVKFTASTTYLEFLVLVRSSIEGVRSYRFESLMPLRSSPIFCLQKAACLVSTPFRYREAISMNPASFRFH